LAIGETSGTIGITGDNDVTEVIPSHRKQLDEWEQRLREQIGQGDLLLGELGFVRQDLDQIGGLLAKVFSLRHERHSFTDTLNQISQQWPLTYALYLALEGIYQYNSEEQYWHGPVERLRVNENYTWRLGREFLDVLARCNLPLFEQSGGYTYVTPILLHGGIPNDFLPHFFEFLWRHEVKPHRIAVDTHSLLQLWRKEPELHLSGLPRPAQRFLQYGGLVATDFVNRCLELFHASSLDESLELIDLPNRVIRAYWEWRQEKNIQARPSRPRIRLQKPVLTLAPYTTGIALYLPPQQFPSSDAPNSLLWRLEIESQLPQIIPTTRQRIEGGYHYTVMQETTVPPAEQYTVQLHADGDCLQTWTVTGIATPPLLIFAPYDDYEGDALNEQERYRPGERWLLYLQGSEWQECGRSRKIRDLPRLAGDWQSYVLQVWQLDYGQMTLALPSGETHSFTILREKAHRRPLLVDGHRLPLPTPSSDFRLYSGRPPALQVHTREPHRWYLTLRAAGDSQPGGNRHHRLSNLPVIRENDSIRLDLSLPDLLGESPVGKFEIVLRGPLGQYYNLGLRLIPFLEIEGLNQLYLENANAPAQLNFYCDASTELRQNPPQDGVELRLVNTTLGDRKQYDIEAQPEVQKLALQLKHASGVVIPLIVPIYRLRWSLHLGQNEESVRWQTVATPVFPGSLLDAQLWVEVPIVREHQLHVGWQLIDGDGTILRIAEPSEQPIQHRLELPLTELTAVWRERQETLGWQLLIDTPDRAEPLIIHAFHLIPTLDFGDLIGEWRRGDDHVELTLLWEHPQPGSYQLQLWSLDRPWVQEPITLVLPATAGSLPHATWQLPRSRLPPEAYLAELMPYNPWQSSLPERPKPDTPNTVIVKPPELDEYYEELEFWRDVGEATIEQLLALLVHDFYHNREELHNTNKAIGDQRATLSLTWLVRWLELTCELDGVAYGLAQWRAFDKDVIERLAKESAPESELERYFAHLPVRPIPKLHAWVLQSGLRQARRRCLTTLCHLTPKNSVEEAAWQIAMSALLEDVTDGTLLIREALLMLSNPRKAAEFLIDDGSQDAADLLDELATCVNLAPTWIAPGMVLDSDLGQILVEKLRHRKTEEIRFCVPIKADYYADGKLLLPPTAVPVRLDLHNQLLHFHSNNTPYLCQRCRQLFSVLADYMEHHQVAHAGQVDIRRRLRRDEKLNRIIPCLSEEIEEALA
jgi:hypothetical protein